jgi:serine protease Do
MYGEVVGISTAKFSGTSSSGASIEGIGFAIPMDDVIGMIEDLRDFGYVTGAYLGVMVRDVDTTAQTYGLPAGAYVQEVTAGTAAERAGLKAQDIIINLGGYDVRSVTDLTRVLRRFEAGQTTTLTVYRAGQYVNLSITLDEKPVDNTTQQPQQSQQPQQPTQPGNDPYDYFNPFDYFFPFG